MVQILEDRGIGSAIASNLSRGFDKGFSPVLENSVKQFYEQKQQEREGNEYRRLVEESTGEDGKFDIGVFSKNVLQSSLSDKSKQLGLSFVKQLDTQKKVDQTIKQIQSYYTTQKRAFLSKRKDARRQEDIAKLDQEEAQFDRWIQQQMVMAQQGLPFTPMQMEPEQQSLDSQLGE